jgi:hypothetical protein
VIKAYFIKASMRKKHSVTPMYHVNALCGHKKALNVKPDGTHNKPLSFKRLTKFVCLSSKQVKI